MDKILQEQTLGQGFLDPSTSPQVKKIKGAHAGLFGDVIRAKVQESGRDRPHIREFNLCEWDAVCAQSRLCSLTTRSGQCSARFFDGKTGNWGRAEVQNKQNQADLINRQQQLKQGR